VTDDHDGVSAGATRPTRSFGHEILTVDLDGYERGDDDHRKAVVDGVSRSLGTGFVYATHGIATDLLDQAYGMLEQFFARSLDAKSVYVVPGSRGGTGYTPPLTETAAVADRPDWKEMLCWKAPLPAGHPLRVRWPQHYSDTTHPDALVAGIGPVLDELRVQLEALQTRFLRVVAEAIGAQANLFDAALRFGPHLTRAIHYPAVDGGTQRWAGEHADINLVTALPRATGPGLEVLTDDGWVPAAPPEGLAILNAGIMLERLTNGVCPAGWHRVEAPATNDAPGDRFSVVQFLHPAPSTVLGPIPVTVTPDRPQRHLPIAAGDLLDEVLYDINLVEDARRLTEP
jgi:isopenicillin N synthase-like dioxygenase